MRNKKIIMIYPCYFDIKRSRRMARRVPKSLAVQNPRLDELEYVAKYLKINYFTEPDAKHPAAWWDLNKGRLMISKKEPENKDLKKAELVKKMAKLLKVVKKKKKEKQERKDRRTRYVKKQQSHKKYIKGQKTGRKRK
ncbi:MAG: signal recognition particle subunit SRP19/SEC65 family protein [Promethearchaeota archaeon]